MATADKTENKTKVLVNVYEPLIAIMKHKFDAACLKRDAYLDKALRIEAGFLRDEVEKPNSDRARNFIAENLKELKLKPLSLSLSIETTELINEVCKDKNIPRDSFINRFFLLMIASDTILKSLFFFHIGKIEDIETAYRLVGNEVNVYFDFYHPDIEKQINGLDIIEMYSNKSPLYIIREAFNEINFNELDFIENGKKIKIYTYVFNKNCFSILPDEYSFIKTKNMFGFNTYIPDDELPKEGTSSPTTLAKNELDKLLAFTKSEKTKSATKKDTNPTEGES